MEQAGSRGRPNQLPGSAAIGVVFAQVIDEIKNWGVAWQGHGRELVQLQGVDLGKLCRAFGLCHGEIDFLKGETRDLKAECTRAKEERALLQEAVRANKNDISNLEAEVSKLHRLTEDSNIAADLLKAQVESEVCRVTLLDSILREEIKSVSQRECERLRMQFQKQLEEIGETSRSHQTRVTALEDTYQELYTECHSWNSRFLAEKHRIENGIAHAQNALVRLEDIDARTTAMEKVVEGTDTFNERTIVQTLNDLSEDVKALWRASDSQALRSVAQPPGHTTSRQPSRSSCVQYLAGAAPPSRGPSRAGSILCSDNSVTSNFKQMSGCARRSVTPPPVLQGGSNTHRHSAVDSFHLGGGMNDQELAMLQDAITRIQEFEDLNKQLLRGFTEFQAKLSKTAALENDVSTLAMSMSKVDARGRLFEKYVLEQLLAAKKDQAHTVMGQLGHDCVGRSRLLRKAWSAWEEFIKHRAELREAVRKTGMMFDNAHVSSRMRAWYYATSKDMFERDVRKLQESVSTIGANLDALSFETKRQNKLSMEQSRSFHQNILGLEKKVDAQASKKADKDFVDELFTNLDARLDKEFNMDDLRRVDDELWNALRKIRKDKLDASVGEQHQERIDVLSRELHKGFDEHMSLISSKATDQDLNKKADARLIEQVLFLLARQADNLACAVNSDLERIRTVLTKFLELSPDIRKAALSCGLEPNALCLSCHPETRKPALEGVIGTDGTTYRSAAGGLQSPKEQARRIVESLRFPPGVTCGLVAGTNSRAPHQQDPLPQLRRLLGQEVGWLAANASSVAPAPVAPAPVSPKTGSAASGSGPSKRPNTARGYFPASSSVARRSSGTPPPALIRSRGAGTHHGKVVAERALDLAPKTEVEPLTRSMSTSQASSEEDEENSFPARLEAGGESRPSATDASTGATSKRPVTAS